MKLVQGINLEAYELIIAEDCNYRCKYCFDEFYKDAAPCSDDIRMSLDLIPDLINFIKQTNNTGNVDITYFGGEPLLNWEFIQEFTPEVRKYFPRASFGTVTNGSLLTHDKVDYLLENNIHTIVSIDGKAETHDVWRIGQGGNSTWDISIMGALRSLAKHPNKNTGINMVLNKDTIHNFFENYEFLVESGFRNITLLINVDTPWSKEQLETLKEQINLITSNRLPLGRSVVRDVDVCHTKSQGNRYCFDPYRNATISSTGELFFCHRFVPKMRDKSQFEHSFGNVRDGYVNRKFFNTMVERTNFDEIEDDLKCSGCNIKYRCAGGCIAAHYFETDDLWKKNATFCKVWNVFINSFKKNLRSERIPA